MGINKTTWQKKPNLIELIRSCLRGSALSLFDHARHFCICGKTNTFAYPTENYIKRYSVTYEQLKRDVDLLSSISVNWQKTLKRPNSFGFWKALGRAALHEYIILRFNEDFHQYLTTGKASFTENKGYWRISYGCDPDYQIVITESEFPSLAQYLEQEELEEIKRLKEKIAFL